MSNTEKIIKDATLGYAFWTPLSNDMFGMSPELVRYRHDGKRPASPAELNDLWKQIGSDVDPFCAKYALTIMVDPSTVDPTTLSHNGHHACFIQFNTICRGVKLSEASEAQIPHLPVLLNGGRRLDLYVQHMEKDLSDRLKRASFICEWASSSLSAERRQEFEMQQVELVEEAEQHGWIARFINRGRSGISLDV
ncbi:hypothetical protein H0H93_012965 [Arthromyces matolae]|nr:hypothetical protein H0H93_012965 [Arthromyces matolae]